MSDTNVRLAKSDATLLASAARTTTQTVEITNKHSGAHIIIDATVDPATASVTPTIDGFDPASGKWYNILTGAAVTAVGTTVLTIHPWITASANVKANDFLPEVFRVVMTVADTDSLTYSIGINYIA